jgi:hypothetical protein
LIVVSMLAGVAVACDDDEDEPSDDEVRAQLCEDVTTLQGEVETLQSLSGESTVGDLRTAREDLQAAVDAVTASAEDVSDADAAGVQSAYDDLTAAVEGLSDELTLTAALEEIQPDIDALEEAIDDLFVETDCEEVTATPTTEAPSETPEAGTTPSGALRTAEAGTAVALTATIEAAVPEVKTAIVETVTAQTAIAGETAVAQTATVEAAIPEVQTAIVGTAIAAQTQTAEAAPTEPPEPEPTFTPPPAVNPQ